MFFPQRDKRATLLHPIRESSCSRGRAKTDKTENDLEKKKVPV
jgi:hypothetical protein